MPPAKHAILGASSSHRWLVCTPSVRLEERFPPHTSVFAEEGTFAHELCEYKVNKYLHKRGLKNMGAVMSDEQLLRDWTVT